MDFLKYIALAAVILFIGSKLYAGFKDGMSGASSARHCLTCGTEGEPRMETPGSFAIEVVLWICFLVPGLIYSLWRLSAKRSVCPACGSRTLVPVDSPAAVNHKQMLSGRPG